MSEENIIVAGRLPDGTIVQVLPDGTTRPFEGRTDWERLRAMTDEEVTAAALTDPDNLPSTPDQLRKSRRVSRAKHLRHLLGLTQEEFAEQFQIPIGTLRDWEQHRCEPDQTSQAYLAVITHDPEGVKAALAKEAALIEERRSQLQSFATASATG